MLRVSVYNYPPLFTSPSGIVVYNSNNNSGLFTESPKIQLSNLVSRAFHLPTPKGARIYQFFYVFSSFLYFNGFHYYYFYYYCYYFTSVYFIQLPLNVFQCDWCPCECCLILLCLTLPWGRGSWLGSG